MSIHKNDHEHEGCEHHHHDHSHNEDCGHDHGENGHPIRHVFSVDELKNFEHSSLETLMQQADELLTQEEYGKVVPVFEIILSKLKTQTSEKLASQEDLLGVQQSLAFSYGIIGEHAAAIPLWKTVIEHKEREENADCSDLLDDYFGMALNCEQAGIEEEFFFYIQKGLKLAKENRFDEYEASFEHELGGFYCDKTDYEKAKKHLENAIGLREKIEDIVGLATSKMYMGILFEEQEKIEEAKTFYESALELTKKEDYCDELIHERAELEERLSCIQNTNLKKKLLNL
jgi:tetratricopeptide (TPR) repeat protein